MRSLKDQKRLIRFRGYLSVLSLLAGHAHANNESSAVYGESIFFDDFPVVITASRLKQPIENAPVAVTVLDRQTIRASGFRDIPDLFRLVPGFQVAYTSGSAGVVTRNGFSDQFSRRMQVLIDGRSVYFSSTGGVFWRDLPITVDDIERIEVVRGPNGATFGSNSFLGVINIITQEALDAVGTKVRFDAGTGNQRATYVRHAEIEGDTQVRVTAGFHNDDGFSDQVDSSSTPYATLRLGWNLSPEDRLDFSLGVTDGTRDNGFYDNVLPPTDDVKVATHSIHAKWEHLLEPDNELSVQFYNASRDERNRFNTEPVDLGPLGLVEIPVNRDLTDERYELELQQTLRPNADLRLVWGASTRLDRVRSKTYFWDDEKLDYRLHRLFAHAEWHQSPQWILNAGAMLEYNDITKTDFSPRISINYKPTDNDTFRFSYARGIRTPALFEEYGDERYHYAGILLEQGVLASGGIAPETIRSVAFSYLGHLDDRSMSWELRLFQDNIQDIIDNYRADSADVGPVDDDVILVENRGELTLQGLEASLTAHIGNHTSLLLNHAITASSGSEFGDEATRRFNEQTVPDMTSSALLSHRFSKDLDASLGYYAVSDMRWDGSGSEVQVYQRIDLRVGKSFRIGANEGEFSLTLQNLLDDYNEFNDDNLFRRRANLMARMDF
jgi:iron complex outermembrane receptor protein